jgi:hypothetical protein
VRRNGQDMSRSTIGDAWNSAAVRSGAHLVTGTIRDGEDVATPTPSVGVPGCAPTEWSGYSTTCHGGGARMRPSFDNSIFLAVLPARCVV